MSERTDERTTGSEDVDVEELLDDDLGGGADDVGGDLGDLDAGSGSEDVGFSDDELGVDVEALTGEPDASASRESAGTSSSSGSSLLSRLTPSLPSLPNPLAALPSGRSVLLSFVVVVVSAAVVGNIPVLGWLPAVGTLGIFAGAFALGVASGESRYLELAVASALVTAVSFTQGFFRFALITDVGFMPIAALGGVIGLLAGVLGHYFGRDLRKGLTRDIE